MRSSRPRQERSPQPVDRATVDRLRRDQAELAAIYENAPLLLCTLDADRRVLHANRAFTTLTGVAEEELRGGRACGVFGCLNAEDDPRGCGFAPACADCGILRAIDDTLLTGDPHLDVEYRASLRTPRGIERRVYLGSTVRIPLAAGPEVLLSLVDVTDRVRAEEALAASEQRFAEATAASSDAVWEWPDLAVPRFWWSPRFFELLGLQPGEVEPTMDVFMDLVHPDDRERIGREIGERLASGRPFSSEYRLRTRSGDHRWFSARGSVLPPRIGAPRRMIGTLHDITDRRLAEEKLRQSEHVHKTVVENSPDIIARFDRNLRHLYVNPAVTSVTALPMQRFIGRTNRDLGMDAPNVEVWDRALREVFASGAPRTIEFVHEGPEGMRWFSSRLIPEKAADGTVATVLSIARDVTRETLAARALAAEERRHRRMLDTLQEGILALDRDGTVVFANERAARLLAADRGTLPGRRIDDFLVAGPDTDPRSTLERWLGSAGAQHECAMVRCDGVQFDAEVRAGRLPAAPGEKDLTVLSILDVSDRRRAARELDTSRDKLRSLARHLLSAREEERRKVAQEIHDELGQSLTGLDMDLRWLGRRIGKATPAVHAKLVEAIDLVERTIRMVQRITSDLRPRLLDDLGIGPALEWLAAEFTRRWKIAATAMVTLTSTRVGGNAATSLFRIVQESLTNVARHARAGRVEIRLGEVTDHLELEVEDDGVGISPAAIDGAQSFGLIGLRERVQELNGSLTITGAPGAGTRVAIRIPFPEGRNLA